MTENKEMFDQIATAFLDKWLEEQKLIPVRMSDFDDLGYRDFLAHHDPLLSRVVEGHTRNEVKKGHENVALAYAITYAILTAYKILQNDKDRGQDV